MREPQWSSDWEKLQAAGLCNDWVRISMTPIIFARRVECDIDAGTVLTTAPLVIGVGGGVWLVHAENGNAGYGAAHRYRLHGNDLVPALEDAEKQAAALARGEGTLEPKEKSYSGGKKA
jgi:hypothetical protein